MWRWLVGFLKSPIVERRDSSEPPCRNFGRPSSVMRQQSTPAARYNQAVFAFRLAREATGHTSAAYSTTGGQLALSKDSEFAKAFTAAKARVRQMDLRFVEETDPVQQALLPGAQSKSGS